MRRRAFLPFLVSGVAGIALVAPAACDSTLNLGIADDGGGAQGEAGSSSCTSVCDKVIGCGLLAADKRAVCVSDCAKQAPQALLDCVARTPCPDLQATCSAAVPVPDAAIPELDSGEEQFQIQSCQDTSCYELQFFTCIKANELAMCRALCASAPAAKRNTFRSCVSGSGSDCSKGQDCLRTFAGD
jgi:hypothetical protein